MKRSNRKRVVILLGPPGAGKGTQAELLSEKLGLHFIETSKILEERYRRMKEGEYVEADGEKYYLADEQKRWATGLLNSFPFVTKLLMEEFQKQAEAGEGLVLAGSPRSLYEAEHEFPLLVELYGKERITLVLIELSEEQSAFRNAHRRLCELMRHPILYSEETKSLTRCPIDGSRLVRREGLDNPEHMRTRFQEYYKHTLPIVGYAENFGISVVRVEGDQSVADVFGDITKALQ